MTEDLAISEHADAIQRKADEATDLEREDALTALAAVARGEPIPKTVRDRIHNRYGDGSGSGGASAGGTANSTTEASYCPSCGEGLDGGERYCPACGEALDG